MRKWGGQARRAVSAGSGESSGEGGEGGGEAGVCRNGAVGVGWQRGGGRRLEEGGGQWQKGREGQVGEGMLVGRRWVSVGSGESSWKAGRGPGGEGVCGKKQGSEKGVGWGGGGADGEGFVCRKGGGQWEGGGEKGLVLGRGEV